MFHDLDLPSQRRLDPLIEAFLLVSAIGPDQLETRKVPFERPKQELAATVVLDIGFMDERVKISPFVSTSRWRLRPLTFLPPSSRVPPFLRRLHRLTVDDGGAGSWLAPLLQAHLFT